MRPFDDTQIRPQGRRRRWSLLAVPLALLLIAGAACGSDSGATTEGSPGTTAAPASYEGVNIRFAATGTPKAWQDVFDAGLTDELARLGATAEIIGTFPAFAPAAEAINAGDADFGTGSITSGLGALAGKTPIRIYAYQKTNAETEGILVPADSPIRTVADLAGKRVAVNRAGTGEYLLLAALDKAGVDLGSVERVYLPPADAGPAFAAGQFDAWATFGNYSASAIVEGGARFIARGDEIGSTNDAMEVVTESFAEEHPGLVRLVFEYLYKARKANVDNPEEQITRAVTDYKQKEPVARWLVERSPNTPELATPALSERWADLSRFFYEGGAIPELVDLDGVLLDVSDVPLP
jgi:sulfonate transport system substrate-binding protein